MKEFKTELPEEFEASYENGTLAVKGSDNEIEKELENALVEIEVSGSEVVFTALEDRRNVTSIAKTFQAHLENMIEGLQEDHVYRMKGVYAHFPMTIKEQGGKVLIENFMGERAPREIDIMEGVEVQVNGEDLDIRGPDKDKVSQTAARIEQACRKGNRDPRVFQDGVYIVEGEKE